MKKTIFLLITLLVSISLFSQRKKINTPKWTFGIQTSNLLALPTGISVNDNFQNLFLLRNSAGLVARYSNVKLKRNLRLGPGLAKEGVMAFDFGINGVWSGYHYQFGEVLGTTDRITWEVPILMVLYDKKNVFVPRKWHRKNISTYTRFGPKLGFASKKEIEKSVNKGVEVVEEKVRFGGINLLWSISGGIMRNFKSGNSAMFEINWTQGFLNFAKGELNYNDGTLINSTNQPFTSNGSYFSMNVIFLFDFKNWKYLPIGKGKYEKIIYNPRYF